jgi:hypothetical protein
MKPTTAVAVLIVILTAGLGRCQAQEASRTPARGLHPVFSATLGEVVSHQKLPVSLMKSLLDSSLVARDSAGHPYPVVSFSFGYQTTNYYQNDTTGRPQSSRTYLSFHFTGNRLDSVWRKGVSAQLKPGDVLYFDRIIARDRSGVQYLAAPLEYDIR